MIGKSGLQEYVHTLDLPQKIFVSTFTLQFCWNHFVMKNEGKYLFILSYIGKGFLNATLK